MKQWSQNTSEYLQQTALEVKEIMLVVAETAKAVGERDQRYARQFGEFAAQLAAIGDLQDLTKVRQSLGKSAQQLKGYVQKMVEEGEKSVSRLRAEVSSYQCRLEESERIATMDPVTGVANRYKAERQLQLRVERAADCSIAIFDLDHFKQINDIYGHPAGDRLLQQFAAELRSFFRSGDVVSRWGGDEFLVIVDCGADQVRDRIEPVRRLINGNYAIPIHGETRNIAVHTSIGIASLRAGETMNDLISRADAEMYREKSRRKSEANCGAQK